MMGSEAELEGFCRFIRNDKVDFEEVLRPHVRATVARMGEHQEVLVVHDTTEFRFLGNKRKGLGSVGSAGQGTAPDAPATRALTPTQLEVLRRHPKSKMPAAARVRDALLAVARLGGHLRSNGDPGWIVLGRGYQQLLVLEVGFRMGRETCGQS